MVDEPLSADAWWQLHEKLQKKETMLRVKGTGTKTKSLRAVLYVSYEELGEEQQDLFVKLAVLPYGVTAPIEMLCHLWDKQVGVFVVKSPLKCMWCNQERNHHPFCLPGISVSPNSARN